MGDSPNQIRDAIRGFILRSVSLPELRDDENLFETGIVNSLFAVQLTTFLEKTFGFEVTMEDLDIENFKSIAAATAFVVKKGRSAAR
jgi:acyl carrier protein